MTYTYLKKGSMRQRPYHLIGDNDTSLCGKVQRGGDGVTSVACAPDPMSDGLVCEKCRQARAMQTIQRVAKSSPFAEAV